MTLCLEQSELIKDDFDLGLLTATPKQPKNTFFYELDLKQNLILHISSSVKEALGYSSAEVVQNGLKWFVEQIHSDDLKDMNHLADHLSHSTFVPQIYYRFKNKSGEFSHLYEYRCLLHDSNGNPSFLIGQIGTT